MFKCITLHYDHELGLASAAFNNAFNRLLRSFKESLGYRADEILAEYPYLPRDIRTFYQKAEPLFEKIEQAQQTFSAFIGSSVIWDNKRLEQSEDIKPHGDLIQLVYETFRMEANNKNQFFVKPNLNEIENRSEQFPWLNVNRYAMLQALYNLTRNAIKYGYNDTNITLKGQACSENGRNGFEFTITNYGIGIPEEDRDNIFLLGFRSETAKESDDQSSIGFGLFIVSKIAKAHDGYLELIECTKISDYHIPLLWQLRSINFTYFSKRQLDDFERLLNDYKAALTLLDDKKLCEDVISQFLLRWEANNTSNFSPFYYDLMLKKPTYKVTFRMWIPLN